MKRIILLINLITITFFMHAQEKLNYQINGESIEFTISETKIYVEFATNQKSRVLRISKEGFEELSNESAILKMSELQGTFQTRKQELKSKISTNFRRIEPVLIYSDGTKQIATGELNIKLNPNVSINDLLKGKPFAPQSNEFVDDLYLVKFDVETAELFNLVNQLQKDSRVEFAEPNFIRILKPHTNDPFFASQWSINNQGYLGGTIDADMDVDEAWNYATGTGIKVAVIDDGVDLTHPDLQSNLLPGFDATDATGGGLNGAPLNKDAHGTACAGIIAAKADNNIGVAGIAYNAEIIPVRIAYDNYRNIKDNWIVDGINWAWQHGADVLSNSYGGGSYSYAIESAINNAVNKGRNGKGSVVLFSSGNKGKPVSFPANVANAISVGASSMCDTRKDFLSCDGESWWSSNFGNALDVVAPGVKIYTTDISGSAGHTLGDYRSDFNGTSSACPNAAGVVALILSIDPSLTQQEAREILESSTDKVGGYIYSNNSSRPNGPWHNEMGYGRVNALKAVRMALIELENIDRVCYNDFKTVNLKGNRNRSVTWHVSSNVTILSRNNSSVTIRARFSNSTGNGWVRATLNNGRVLQDDFKVGVPSGVRVEGDGLDTRAWTFYGASFENPSTIRSIIRYEWSIPNVAIRGSKIRRMINISPYRSGVKEINVRVRACNICGCSSWASTIERVHGPVTSPSFYERRYGGYKEYE